MKTKKIVAILLCLVIVFGTLTGCAAKPYEEFFRLYGEIQNIKSGDYSSTISIHVPKNLSKSDFLELVDSPMEDLEESIDIVLKVSGTQNVEEELVSANIEYSYNDDELKPLLNLIVDGEDVYMNADIFLDAVIDLVEMISGEDLSKDEKKEFKDMIMAEFDNEEWVKTDMNVTMMEESIDPWEYTKDQEDLIETLIETLSEEIDVDEDVIEAAFDLLLNIWSTIKESINTREFVIKAEDGSYVLTINDESLKMLFTDLITDMEADIDKYWPSIEVLFEEAGEEIDKDDFEDGLDDLLEAFEEEFEDVGYELSLAIKYDKKEKAYVQKGSFYLKNTLELTSENYYYDNCSEIEIPDAFDATDLVEEGMADMDLSSIFGGNSGYGYDYTDDEDFKYEELETPSQELEDEIIIEEPTIEETPTVNDIDVNDLTINLNYAYDRPMALYANDINMGTVINEAGIALADEFVNAMSISGFEEEWNNREDNDFNIEYIYYDKDYNSNSSGLNICIKEDSVWVYYDLRMGQKGIIDENNELLNSFVDAATSMGYYLDKNEIINIVNYLYTNREALTNNENHFYSENIDFEGLDISVGISISYWDYNDSYPITFTLRETVSEYSW